MEGGEGRQPKKRKLEEEMLEVKQGLLLTVVVCRMCNGERRLHVVDNRRGGIVAQLCQCPQCGAGGDNRLMPVDVDNVPLPLSQESHQGPCPSSQNEKKPSANTTSDKPPSIVTFERAPSPPEPPEEHSISCRFCRMEPCIFVQLEHDILKHDTAINTVNGKPTLSMPGIVENRERREAAYRYVSCRLYGYVGRADHKKMPRCVEEGIRSLFPAFNGLHVSHYLKEG